jgi:hypothetical protein
LDNATGEVRQRLDQLANEVADLRSALRVIADEMHTRVSPAVLDLAARLNSEMMARQEIVQRLTEWSALPWWRRLFRRMLQN